MNLTYVIGNGFDLGLGLKTSYRDFLRCYLCKESSCGDSPSVCTLKGIICQNQDSWGDAEREFGKLDYLKFGEKGALVSCAVTAYEDFRACLKRYIRNEEKRLPKTVRDDVCARFRQSLLSIHTGFVDAKIRAEFLNDIKSIHVNFLTFNYTQTLEKLLGVMSIQSSSVEAFGTKIGVYFHKPLHVHGEIQHDEILSPSSGSDIVFGIGDYLQLSGLPYNGHQTEFEQLRSFLEKKDNEQSKKEGSPTSIAVKTLSESDCIILFGVSLGVTDCFWWKAILEILRAKPTVKLVFSPFHDDCPVGIEDEAFAEEERKYVVGCIAEGIMSTKRHEDPEMLFRMLFKKYSSRILVIGPGPHLDYDGASHFYDPLHLSFFRKKLGLH